MKTLSESIIGRKGGSQYILKSGDIVETAEKENNRYLYLGPEYIDLFTRCFGAENPGVFLKGILVQTVYYARARAEFGWLDYVSYDNWEAPEHKYDIIGIIGRVDLKKQDLLKMHPEKFKRFLEEVLKN